MVLGRVGKLVQQLQVRWVARVASAPVWLLVLPHRCAFLLLLHAATAISII